jgi:hypothetical protein
VSKLGADRTTGVGVSGGQARRRQRLRPETIRIDLLPHRMMDQVEDSFVVVDPYNSFFGYGNPKVTTQFSSDDPEHRGYSLLVIHGAGAEAWHSATPKAKFIIINLPFKQVVVKKLAIKKKRLIMGIYAEETGGDQATSVVFWDGRKYKYQPLGSSME